MREGQKPERWNFYERKKKYGFLALSDCLSGGPYKLNGVLKIKIVRQRVGVEGVSGDRTIDPKIYSN